MRWSSNELLPKRDPVVRERRLAAALFVLTAVSVFGVTTWRWGAASMGGAAVFTTAFLGILLIHELGHWSVARAHGFALSLPLFLPFPFVVGTLGAVIRLRSRAPDRSALVEMGAAGPLAGLAVTALVTVAWMLGDPTPVTEATGSFSLGLLGAPVATADLVLSRPLLFWLVSAALGEGAPPSAHPEDPLGFAAWLGCLLTALNLLPVGQLDGGHVLSGLFPEAGRPARWAVVAALLVAALWWPGWALWLVAFSLAGAQSSAEVRVAHRPPSRRARLCGVAALVAFVLTFTPLPIGGLF